MKSKNTRFVARVVHNKRSKDYSLVVMDMRQKSDIFFISGYDTEPSAKRAYTRYAKSLFKEGAISASWVKEKVAS